MRESINSILAYLNDDIGGGVKRINQKIADISTEWGITIPAPLVVRIGYAREAQYPAIAILPARVSVTPSGGHRSLNRTNDVVIGCACTDLDDTKLINQILAYQKAIHDLVGADPTLLNRVSDCQENTCQFYEDSEGELAFRTFDMILTVNLKPSDDDLD